jgi:nicotinamidase-related amidase
MASGLRSPLTSRSVHLCIDMQRIFMPEGPWATPWMERVLPRVERLVAQRPEATVFTRFITPQNAEDMPGSWRIYYERWRAATRSELDPAMLDLVPELARYAPPAMVFDKPVYSAFAGARLAAHLAAREADALVISGAETDVCVLATVLGAIDHGYRVVLATDCLCSSSDECHDALMTVYYNRWSLQVEVADSDTIIDSWV